MSADEYLVLTRGESCEHTRPGVFVDGAEAGRVLRVCTDATCATHRAAATQSADTEDCRAQERERAKAVKRERVVLRHVLDATMAALPLPRGPSLAVEELRLVARSMLERLWAEYPKQMAKARTLEPKTARHGGHDYLGAMHTYLDTLTSADLLRLLVEMALIADAWPSLNGGEKPTHLLAVAKRAGVNVTKIRAALADEKPASKDRPSQRARSSSPAVAAPA